MNAYSWRIPWRAVLVAAAIGACTTIATKSDAACYCTCVNGYVQALCENDFDVPPVCAPRVCAPAFTPTPRPVDPPVVPPPGRGTDCKYERVWYDHINSYQWELVCR